MKRDAFDYSLFVSVVSFNVCNFVSVLPTPMVCDLELTQGGVELF